MTLDNALNNFKAIAEQKFNFEKIKEQQNDNLIEEKKKLLLPIVNLFRYFKEIGLVVFNAKKYATNPINYLHQDENDELFFTFTQKNVVGMHAPGIEFIVKHPCEIRILIPNKVNQKEFGLVYIAAPDTKCPHVELIKNKNFKSVDDACVALSSFFAHNAVKITNLKED